MTKDELIQAFFAPKNALQIQCFTLEERRRVLDLLLPYAPNKDLSFVADQYSPHKWPMLGWGDGALALWNCWTDPAITVRELEEIMTEEPGEELVSGDTLEELL